MDRLVFSYNWNNKLAGKYFTSLRLKNVNRFRLDDTYEIYLRKGKIDTFFCHATLMAERHMKLNEINAFIAGIDTGYSVEECRNMIQTMYKHKNIDWNQQQLSFLLFRKNEKVTIKETVKETIEFFD